MNGPDRGVPQSFLIFHAPELPDLNGLHQDEVECDLRDSRVPLRAVETLDDIERATVSRFRSAHDRRRFVWRRCLRRHLLAEALGAEPRELVFATICPRCGSREHGKPYLPDAPHLHFSAAQSEDQTAIAIGPAPFGIDIQRPSHLLHDGGEDMFTSGEQAELKGSLHKAPRVLRDISSRRLRMRQDVDCKRFVLLTRASSERGSKHAGDRRRAVLWVRKEAYLKALGLGLAIEPAAIDARTPGFIDGVFGSIKAPGQLAWSVASWTLPDAALAIACATPQPVRLAEIAAVADQQTGRLAIKATIGGHEDEIGIAYAPSGAGGRADLSRGR